MSQRIGTPGRVPGQAASPLEALEANLNLVMVGRGPVIKLLLTALVARGHVLLEDVPGTGKTVLVKALARSLAAEFRRIQCTPDLLPSDITGVSVFDQSNHRFEFQAGPIFANLVLADEINRANPRTQAALLEAMAEGQVTSEAVSRPLPVPHFVVATQNPYDMQGTYHLPQSQLDRFWLTLDMGATEKADLITILSQREHADPLLRLQPVAALDDLVELQGQCSEVSVAATIRLYLAGLAESIRAHPEVVLPASVRAILHLQRLSQAWALVNERSYVLPDDVKALVKPALAHRLAVKPRSDPAAILDQVVEQTPLPLR